MPGMSGYELAERAKRIRRGLHVTLTRESSGHRFPLIRKPFLRDDLNNSHATQPVLLAFLVVARASTRTPSFSVLDYFGRCCGSPVTCVGFDCCEISEPFSCYRTPNIQPSTCARARSRAASSGFRHLERVPLRSASDSHEAMQCASCWSRSRSPRAKLRRQIAG